MLCFPTKTNQNWILTNKQHLFVWAFLPFQHQLRGCFCSKNAFSTKNKKRRSSTCHPKKPQANKGSFWTSSFEKNYKLILPFPKSCGLCQILWPLPNLVAFAKSCQTAIPQILWPLPNLVAFESFFPLHKSCGLCKCSVSLQVNETQQSCGLQPQPTTTTNNHNQPQPTTTKTCGQQPQSNNHNQNHNQPQPKLTTNFAQPTTNLCQQLARNFAQNVSFAAFPKSSDAFAKILKWRKFGGNKSWEKDLHKACSRRFAQIIGCLPQISDTPLPIRRPLPWIWMNWKTKCDHQQRSSSKGWLWLLFCCDLIACLRFANQKKNKNMAVLLRLQVTRNPKITGARTTKHKEQSQPQANWRMSNNQRVLDNNNQWQSATTNQWDSKTVKSTTNNQQPQHDF